MKAFITLSMLLLAESARGQSHVYTNADLGKPIASSSARVSPAQAAAIMAAHQPVFAAAGSAPDGPRVFIMDSRPGDGPFGPLQPFRTSLRLDGTRLSRQPELYGQPLWWFQPSAAGRRLSAGHRGAGARRRP